MPKDPLELPKNMVTFEEFMRHVIQAVRELPEEQKAEMRRQLYAYLLPQKNSNPTDPPETPTP